MTTARHSKANPDWFTPAYIVEAAREVMGGIDLDPASCEEANRIVNARQVYTAENDGLHVVNEWFWNVFLNPPGGQVKRFWEKLVREYIQCRVKQAVWIGYSLEQLQTLQHTSVSFSPLHYSMCVPSKRIAFVENEAMRETRIAKQLAAGKKPTKGQSPTHANYISYLGPNVDLFQQVFGEIGQVVVPR